MVPERSLTLFLFIVLPASNLQYQNSRNLQHIQSLLIDFRCSNFRRLILLRGGNSESGNESEPGSSERFKDYPLQVAHDNLAELLGQDTEEGEPVLDDVIMKWADKPVNETESTPLSFEEKSFSNSSDSEAPSSDSQVDEVLPVIYNNTDPEKIRQDVAKRKSARCHLCF